MIIVQNELHLSLFQFRVSQKRNMREQILSDVGLGVKVVRDN
jgi:hypothetical protein